MILLGYDCKNVYRCYDPYSSRIIFTRDIKFIQESNQIEIFTSGDDKNESDVSSNSSSTSKSSSSQNSKTSSSSSTSTQPEPVNIWDSILITDSESEETNTPFIPRRSTRKNKGVPPERYGINAIVEPKNLSEALSNPDREKWIKAMNDEIDSMHNNKTWIVCDLPKDRKAVGCKWLFKIKTDEKGNIDRYKARLVAKGYTQKFGEDYDLVFAPVVKQTTFRILMSIASKYKLFVRHFDVKTAFLNGSLDEEIYMQQPPGYEEEGKVKMVCHLKRSIYGLKQAARSWNEAINEALIVFGFKRSKNDHCLYYLKMHDGNYCILLIYVDDIRSGATRTRSDLLRVPVMK